jgi:hypothetical protein
MSSYYVSVMRYIMSRVQSILRPGPPYWQTTGNNEGEYLFLFFCSCNYWLGAIEKDFSFKKKKGAIFEIGQFPPHRKVTFSLSISPERSREREILVHIIKLLIPFFLKYVIDVTDWRQVRVAMVNTTKSLKKKNECACNHDFCFLFSF